jgi:aerobic-type carbon monoxide dehydrogenase small subunit (CoxS/CutS family)
MDQSSLTPKGKPHSCAVAPDSPPLWVLRVILGFTGTAFGCGPGLRGARTAAGTSR